MRDDPSQQSATPAARLLGRRRSGLCSLGRLCGLRLGLALGDDRAHSSVEELVDVGVRLGRDLPVLRRADLAHKRLTLLGGHRVVGHLVAQIGLQPDEEDGDATQVVLHLGEPLVARVLQRLLVDKREADEDDVRARVAQRAQLVKLLLPGCIPERKVDLSLQETETYKSDVMALKGKHVKK